MGSEPSVSVLTLPIAVVGEMPADTQKADSMLARVGRIIGCAVKTMMPFATGAYGFAEGAVRVRLVSAPGLIDGALLARLKAMLPTAETVGLARSAAEKGTGFAENVVIEGFDAQETGTWLADQADFAVVCCDTRAYGQFVAQCQDADIPAVVVSTAQDGYSTWTEKTAYDSFDEETLAAYITGLFPDRQTLHDDEKADRAVFGYRLLWGGLYQRYMQKHSATGGPAQPAQDTLFDEKKRVGAFNAEQDAVRRQMIQRYAVHDAVSMKYADRYRSSIYLRAVIPLVTTIALAIGFYAETLLKSLQGNIPGTRLNWLSVAAGFGFFLYALLNLYVFWLSENDTVQAWHRRFIDNRFIAEALRVTAHFIPFGIPVNLNKTLAACGMKIKKSSAVARRLRCTLRGAQLPAADYSKDTAYECMLHVRELVDEQIAYHKKTANRLANICISLERWAKAIFYLGFGFVLLRGCLQLAIAFGAIPLADGQIGWLRSFANMLALLIPTWAGYFNLKLSLCSFRTLYNNSVSMIDELTPIKEMISEIGNQNDASYTELKRLSEATVTTLLREITDWYGQIEGKKVTRL